ncbi:hypothetical protein Rhopal_000539-T1 [Rhodotorula paludigena]|uniref:Monopolin complex subunit Csm1/Pcs1 C-terminal domain-containing protein n=1 Tax=Rhodotorula paludigena TaxID=86838 RepID=A0AAV5GCL2_9BASI|nr:hypothetical protein Rhopal_000539-T1 [Rhodotorula paludigena]
MDPDLRYDPYPFLPAHPSGSSFWSAGKGAATSRARGKSAATAAAKKAPAARGKKAIPQPEEDDDADELMLDDQEDDEEDETVLVAETQADGGDELGDEGESAPAKGRGGRKAAGAGAAAARKAGAKKAAPAATAAKKGKPTEALLADEMDEDGETRPTPKETRLEAQLEATQKKLAALEASFAKLSNLRSTRAEEAETRLREIADERQQAALNTISTYKTESDALRHELASLQETAFASPRSKAARLESLRVQELEQENAALVARAEELERAAAEERETREREAEERERRWEKELTRRVREVTEKSEKELVELRAELSTARAELSAEVSHSISLQQQLKANPSSSSVSSTSTAPAASGSSAAVAKLQEENERLTSHLNLNEDLTGFAVHSVKQDETGATYVCVLNDCAGTTGSLNFKLVFHPDGTVSYTPDVNAERDAVLASVLSPELQRYMRFGAEMSAEFFKRLFNAVNKIKA